MINTPSCTDKDKEALLAYLYDECGPADREQVEAHMATCRRCADEVQAFRAVRESLDTWTVPEPPLGLRIVSERDASHRPRWMDVLRPAWGLAAAAGVVLGVGLALGGAEIRYTDDAVVFRVGRPAPASVPEPSMANGGADVASAPRREANTPQRTDLVALENQRRRELSRSDDERPGQSVPGRSSVAVDRDTLIRQVQGLISESERRQQQERALWLTEFAQELSMQRRADRHQLQQELGALEGYADYLVRVSQR